MESQYSSENKHCRTGASTAASRIGVFCGDLTVSVSSTGNVLYFVAYSDGAGNRSGYKFDFKLERRYHRQIK